MRRILPVIVLSQFFSTSLWFAGNAIMPDMIQLLHLTPNFLAHLTSAVQFGFIVGTLVFAVLAISDRFSPSLVFCCCAIIAAGCNLGITIISINVTSILMFRFLTGFFLAGIYPVGMKIASDYYQKGLGKSLGFLVGALVIGTAFPHFLKNSTTNLPWKYVMYGTSILSIVGGLAMWLLVPNGPFRKRSPQIAFSSFIVGFRNSHFRAAAIGYFGHMWELYTFWTFVPVMLLAYHHHFPQVVLNIPFWSFLIIASGALACVCSGIISQYVAVKKVATICLFLSCACCLLSPLFLFNPSTTIFIAFLFFWGLVVIADSPLFSTLVAQQAPVAARGTSLTIVNCIGFSITIVSIQLLRIVSNMMDVKYAYLLLAVGPIIGLVALLRSKG